MSRRYIEQIWLGPTGLDSGGAVTLVGSILVSKLMAGIVTGNPLSVCFIDIELTSFGGVDSENGVYIRTVRGVTSIGLDETTYVLGNVTRSDVYQGNSDPVLVTPPSAALTCDINSGDLRIFAQQAIESLATVQRATAYVRSYRAFDI